jgi:hypothetical protein
MADFLSLEGSPVPCKSASGLGIPDWTAKRLERTPNSSCRHKSVPEIRRKNKKIKNFYGPQVCGSDTMKKKRMKHNCRINLYF